MQKKLTTSTALNPVGQTAGRKVFILASGPYAGRMVALIQSSISEIALTYADAPYTSWSALQAIVTDAADDAFDAAIDSAGNLCVAYSDLSTCHISFKRLPFSNGVWTDSGNVAVYSSAQGYTPSIALESSGKLWVTWSRFTSPNKYVHVKSSIDNGATWGSGPTDSGTQLTTGELFAYSKLLIGPGHVHVVAVYGNSKIVMRSLPLAGGSWSEEAIIGTTATSIGSDFDAAVAPDGRVAVVYNDPSFRYREFDGLNWGALITLSANSVASPQMLFRNDIPVVTYLESWNGIQKIMKYVERKSGSFSTPKPLDSHARAFDRVLLYNQPAASYADITSAAESATTGDLFHPASSCLLKNSGDQMYLGMNVTFRYVQLLLSTLGSGGTLVFSYWDGSNWRAFTPSSGTSCFDSSIARIVLWEDYASIPADWQKRAINGRTFFWLKTEVASPFATGPIGSQATSISELSRVILRR